MIRHNILANIYGTIPMHIVQCKKPIAAKTLKLENVFLSGQVFESLRVFRSENIAGLISIQLPLLG